MSNPSKSSDAKEMDLAKHGSAKMGEMPVHRLFLTMSIPLMISMMVQSLYNIVDKTTAKEGETITISRTTKRMKRKKRQVLPQRILLQQIHRIQILRQLPARRQRGRRVQPPRKPVIIT